jgi:hypothetical protein
VGQTPLIRAWVRREALVVVTTILTAGLLSMSACREGQADVASGVITADTLDILPSGDTLDLGPFAGLAVSALRFVIVSGINTREGEQLALYDSTGRLVRLFGRRGGGPGELTPSPGATLGPGDTLFAGGSVFTPPPELRFVRTRVRATCYSPTSEWAEARQLREGEAPPVVHPRIITGGLYFKGRLWPQCELTWSGEKVRTYGRPIVTDNYDRDSRTTAPAGDTLLWSAERRRYVIELRGVDSVYRRIVRRVDWFPDDTTTQWSPESRPPPRIASIREDEGVLWVVITRAGRGWRPTTVRRDSRGIPTAVPLELPEHMYESVVEALDPGSGELIASTLFSPSVHFVARGVVSQKLQDSTGGYWLRVLRLRLTR